MPAAILKECERNRALTEALTNLAGKRRFNEIVLAAPDIDADVFERDIAPRITGAGRRVTLYGSAADKAIHVSRRLNKAPRAGDGGDAILVIDGIETVDVTALGPDLMGGLGHSYVADIRTVVEDMQSVLLGLPPEQRHLERRLARERAYWAFRP